MVKRNCRFAVFLDSFDYALLHHLQYFPNTSYRTIQKEFNISRKALLVHIERLAYLNLIEKVNGKEVYPFNYKYKYLSIKKNGIRMCKLFPNKVYYLVKAEHSNSMPEQEAHAQGATNIDNTNHDNKEKN